MCRISGSDTLAAADLARAVADPVGADDARELRGLDPFVLEEEVCLRRG